MTNPQTWPVVLLSRDRREERTSVQAQDWREAVEAARPLLSEEYPMRRIQPPCWARKERRG